MSIRAITFDLWSTLLENANGKKRREFRYEAFARETGVPLDEVHEAWRFAATEFDRCHREENRTLHADDYLAIMCEQLGVTVEGTAATRITEAFATAILEYPPVPIDGALEAVRAAAERFPLGLISDTGSSPGRVLRRLMADYGFLEPFEVTVFSDEEGTCKPDPAVYGKAAERLGVSPDQLLHIGDLEYSDIAGAHAVGAKAALYTGVNDTYLENTCADYVFRTWDDFLAVLPEL
jgi:putative hydrolase of the HAD superfamily